MTGAFNRRAFNRHTFNRRTCDRCKRAERTCLCSFIRPIANTLDVLIVQDLQEARHAKNTGGLLHLSLTNSCIYACNSNGAAPPEQLADALFQGNKLPLLLYPLTPEATSLGLAEPAPLPQLHNIPPAQLRLVVLDATWRKSRKLLYLNPLLQRLPRFTLNNPPQSLYRIRKANSENQLSTLEASCYALQQLEGAHIDYSPLLDAMREFVDQHSAFRPTLDCIKND